MRKDFLVFGSPLIGEEEVAEVADSMRAAWLGTGPKVMRFEEAFRQYTGAAHAVAVSSCTAALQLSLKAAGVGPGDEVITTPLTFCATVNAIIHAGATPVLADVDPVTQNIDPREVERRITSRTRALLPVHFAGRLCDMDALVALARQHRLTLIEDCAHAIETEGPGGRAGSYGDFACFSFYATKNLTTGEGGMILAKDPERAARAKRLALHGLSADAWRRFSDSGYKHYYVTEAGFKYNMMDLQAAIGLHQLKRLETSWKRREEVWNRYQRELSALPLVLPAPVAPGTRHAYHLYTVQVDDARTGVARDALLDRMTKHKIGVGVHYLSIPEHPYYRETYGWRPEDFPHAMRIGRRTLSIPLTPKLTDADVGDVIAALGESLKP